MNSRNSDRPGVRIVSAPGGGAAGETDAPRFFGLTAHERLARALARAGADTGGSPDVLIRDDYIYDEILISALLAQRGTVLVDSAGAAVAVHGAEPGQAETLAPVLLRGEAAPLLAAGLRRVDPVGLASAYNHGLRKRVAPYLLQVKAESAIAIERRMFDGAYKGVTDFVTKRVWPWPAFHATRFCARTGISPNMVTAVSGLFVLLAMWWFWRGDFALGLAAAWGMCFLDTVDGKLARVTLRSSPFGNVFDHGIDLIHPPFWYWAWYHGLKATTFGGADSLLGAALLMTVLGYIGGRLQEGIFELLWKIQMHVWRPVDSWFREITARRNPNLFILTVAVVLGEPGNGFIAVAAWTALSFLFHTVRIAQAALATAMGRAPISWLREPVSPLAHKSP